MFVKSSPFPALLGRPSDVYFRCLIRRAYRNMRRAGMGEWAARNALADLLLVGTICGVEKTFAAEAVAS